MEDYTFRESQFMRQPWLWGLVLAVTVAPIILISVGMYQQLALHQPFGDKPMSDGTLMIFGPCMILLMIGILVMFSRVHLITEVRGDGVYVRYVPFHRRFHWYHFDTILTAKASTYRPIRDYGGWGI